MKEFLDAFSAIGNWAAFRITFVGTVVLILLLLMGDFANIEKSIFLQMFVVFLMGSAVLSYIHALAHSHYMLINQAEEGEAGEKRSPKDLPTWAQCVAMAVHFAWWIAFAVTALWF